ncbi:MAG: gephyrin-like molybdotransferase Glp [Anaerolineae bacterium]
MPMISVDEARNYTLSRIDPLPAEEVELLDALDRVLAEDVVAEIDIPPFSNSAMDGYAVRAGDTAGASSDAPVVLRVIEEVAAGAAPTTELGPGTAARIMTGAPIPRGADAVVKVEDTSEERGAPHNSTVRVHRGVSPGENVRPAGEDVQRGQRVLAAGRLLRPQEIGVLASLGRPSVRVHRRPRVGLLATGNHVDEGGRSDNAPDVNTYTLAALVRRYGGDPVRLDVTRDAESLAEKIQAGLEQQSDLLLTSAGDFEMVKDMLPSESETNSWQVALRPVRTLVFGQIAGVPALGVPGDPVAASVAFEVFVRPILRRMAGWTRWEKPRIRATLREDVATSPETAF